MNSFIDVIDRWPSLQALAHDLDVGYSTAQAMRYRNSISSVYWQNLVEAAARRKIKGISLELLAKLRAERRVA
jgi:hypothetical protein